MLKNVEMKINLWVRLKGVAIRCALCRNKHHGGVKNDRHFNYRLIGRVYIRRVLCIAVFRLKWTFYGPLRRIL